MLNSLKRLHRKIKINGYVARCFSTETHQNVTKPVDAKLKIETAKLGSDVYGQPTFTTHPHLLKEGELLPGIPHGEFIQRRQKLAELIRGYSSKLDTRLQNHLIVIPSSTKKYMSDKIPYTFRQNTEFLYLTGCLEPDCCLVISMVHGRADKSYLFLRPNDDSAELWEGPRTGVDKARLFFNVDESESIDKLDNFLNKFKMMTKSYSLWFDHENCDYPVVSDIMKNYIKGNSFQKVEAPTVFIQKLRLIKSAYEVNLMQKSCAIAAIAINDTITSSVPGVSEQTLYAKVDSRCRELGAERLAYPPVVAGGSRANIIHYINNNHVVNDKEMVLMDAGCEYRSFSSDITRTWPVNGKFTDPQRVLYEIVLKTQKDIIDNMMENGYPSLDMLFTRMCLSLGKSLQEVGIIDKSVPEKELPKLAYGFCPHHVSHYLGMDVHDTPLIPRSIPVHPGMIITIEPGIYIPETRKDVPERFRGLAVRIEDDILITNKGPMILTHYCAKEVADVEKLFDAKEQT